MAPIYRARQFWLALCIVMTCVLIGAAYVSVPFIRASRLEKKIRRECRIWVIFPSKVFPQTRWLQIQIYPDTTQQQVDTLYGILAKELPKSIEEIMIDVTPGSKDEVWETKWAKKEASRFTQLGADLGIKIQIINMKDR